MPLIRVTTSAAAPADAEPLLQELSRTLAELLGKPERYVMTLLEAGVPMTFAGETTPACCVTVKSIGALDGERPRRLSAALAQVIERHLGIPADRTYLDATEVPARLWGWNGNTFG